MPASSTDPLDELRLMWIFTGPDGEDIGLTLSRFAEALTAREPEPFTSAWDDPADGAAEDTTMSFSITLDGQPIEGIASTDNEGASIQDATVAEAVEFAAWMRDELVSGGKTLTANTRQGMEDELPDIPVTGRTDDQLFEDFAEHARTVA
ncbi:hypothetical protein [Streptacidiphilus fuscans]|uniref:Uncharacterized protein n=1 Tax=Streptacidiphilus fuscans TaxID=2789292 RepID=A0A931FHG6_9ACTN|nr:hypothetical protein [Streptacidiphilus fuscans]MBF9071811.1 hypothetical protein [Streptacidiphilus fuscans]